MPVVEEPGCAVSDNIRSNKDTINLRNWMLVKVSRYLNGYVANLLHLNGQAMYCWKAHYLTPSLFTIDCCILKL